jgi:hypothetical protein
MRKKSKYFNDKVHRLLDEDKVHLSLKGKKYIWAEVKGNTQTYTCSFNRETSKWTCTCTYKTNYNIHQEVYCTHLEAAEIKRVKEGLK